MSLAGCSAEQLSWLAGQQGFVGITVVEGNQCEWQRAIDFQPPLGKRDIGRMHFAHPDKLLEYGIEDTYSEIWERVAGGGNKRCYALQLLDRGELAEPVIFLMVSGSHFIYTRNRPAGLEQPFSSSEQLQQYPYDALVRALDFEISFGQIQTESGSGQIILSTLPWREGQTAFDRDPMLAAFEGICPDLGSGKTWRVLSDNR